MSKRTPSELTEKLLMNMVKAEETGQIDPSICKELSIFHSHFEKLKDFWLKEGRDLKSSFALFHASKNCCNILGIMIKRFKNAHEENQNPAVAIDAISVLPSIFELKDILDNLKPDEVDRSISYNILDRVRDLRIHARRLQMLPSEEEEVKKISLKKSKNGFEAFSKNVLGMYFEEQGSS